MTQCLRNTGVFVTLAPVGMSFHMHVDLKLNQVSESLAQVYEIRHAQSSDDFFSRCYLTRTAIVNNPE